MWASKWATPGRPPDDPRARAGRRPGEGRTLAGGLETNSLESHSTFFMRPEGADWFSRLVAVKQTETDIQPQALPIEPSSKRSDHKRAACEPMRTRSGQHASRSGQKRTTSDPNRTTSPAERSSGRPPGCLSFARLNDHFRQHPECFGSSFVSFLQQPSFFVAVPSCETAHPSASEAMARLAGSQGAFPVTSMCLVSAAAIAASTTSAHPPTFSHVIAFILYPAKVNRPSDGNTRLSGLEEDAARLEGRANCEDQREATVRETHPTLNSCRIVAFISDPREHKYDEILFVAQRILPKTRLRFPHPSFFFSRR